MCCVCRLLDLQILLALEIFGEINAYAYAICMCTNTRMYPISEIYKKKIWKRDGMSADGLFPSILTEIGKYLCLLTRKEEEKL